jgi:S-layer protein
LNVNGLTTTGAVVTPTIKTLNIASTGSASTIADLQAAAATAINVSGDAKLTLTANTIGAATTVSSSAQTAGGLVLGTALGDAVTFTGGAGADSIKIGSTTKAITLGAGDDTVTTSTGLVGTGGSVAAGDGTADKIIFTTTANAVTAGSSSTFSSHYSRLGNRWYGSDQSCWHRYYCKCRFCWWRYCRCLELQNVQHNCNDLYQNDRCKR